MRKGIAIQTVLFLLIGIVVVSVVIYLVYRISVSSSALSEQACRGRMVSWCTACSVSNFQSGSGMSQELKDCAKKYWNIKSYDNCRYVAKNCTGFLPGCPCNKLSGDVNRDGKMDIFDWMICSNNGCTPKSGDICTC